MPHLVQAYKKTPLVPGKAQRFLDLSFLQKAVPAFSREATLPRPRPLFFDLDSNYIRQEVKQVSAVAKNGQEYLHLEDLIVEEEGLVRIFVANESEVDVWFDDLKIVHSPALIVQENHYYPFGLNLAGIEKKGSPEHKWQYNGKEKQEEFDLNWLDYGA